MHVETQSLPCILRLFGQAERQMLGLTVISLNKGLGHELTQCNPD